MCVVCVDKIYSVIYCWFCESECQPLPQESLVYSSWNSSGVQSSSGNWPAEKCLKHNHCWIPVISVLKLLFCRSPTSVQESSILLFEPQYKKHLLTHIWNTDFTLMLHQGQLWLNFEEHSISRYWRPIESNPGVWFWMLLCRKKTNKNSRVKSNKSP